MKMYASLTVSALIVAATMNTASAFDKYCPAIPNGKTACDKTTGHNDKGNTAFGAPFKGVWDKAFCQSPYPPDETMTNGAAFGDPCCSWTIGTEPDFKISSVINGDATTKAHVCTKKDSGGSGAPSTPEAGTNTKGETPEAGTNTKGETPEAGTNTKGETPETDVSQTPPAEGTTETPAEGGGAETPAEGGGAETPAEGGGAETPAEGGGAETPAVGGGAETPPPANEGAPAAGKGCAAKGARKLRS